MPPTGSGLPNSGCIATVPSRPRRIVVVLLVALSLILGTLLTVMLSRPAGAVTLGAGSYTTTLPAGASLPSGCGTVANPRANLTANAPKGPLPTNDWWTSILFKRTDCSFGEPMLAHPAAYDTYPGGLGISYPTIPTITGSATGTAEYHFAYARDVLVGVAGLAAPNVKVDGWSDWTVSPWWGDGTRTLRATIGHGLPLSYYTMSGGDAQLSVDGTPSIWLNSGSRIGFTIRNHDYVAYAPTGATWTVSGSVLTSGLAGKNYLTVAVLPTTPSSSDSDRLALANSFGTYAFAAVTGTKATYSYTDSSRKVTTRYAVTTTAEEGTQTNTVLALYPHEWKALTGASLIPQTYVSPRGTMKTLVGVSGFSTAMTFTGVLPEVPAVADSSGADLATLTGYLNDVAADPEALQKPDTYWTGKGLGRAARVAEISDQVDATAARDKALAAIKSTLDDWFTASAGKTDHLFYYDQNWGTLIGYQASYGSDTELNDHHFHYGYYVAAAATLAKFDPGWASSYGPMVNLLIRDANDPNRSDSMFPYLRDFDIYAGHDWASGHGSFAAGNDQESSSEGMNFAGALIQWGQATGNTAIRNAGIYIYTTEAAAIDNYWFDVDGTNFPSTFPHQTVGMVWGDGGAYATWFSAEPEMISGINHLPITGSHLYLGDSPSYVVSNYNEMVKLNGGEPTVWQDIWDEYLALGDGGAALSKFRASSGFTSEEGESKAHTFHWVDNLAALGNVDPSVSANYPLAAVFTKSGQRTYVISNLTTASLTVTFSDGKAVTAPAGRTVAVGAQNWSGGHASAPTATPSATPTTTPTTATPTPSLSSTPTPSTTATSPTPTPTQTATPTPSSTPTATSTATGLPSGSGTPGQLFLQANGTLGSAGAPSQVNVAAANCQCDGTPHTQQTFVGRGVNLHYTGGTDAFDLFVDAGTAVGSATQLRLSFDLTGNGSWDRVETYRYFPTDPIPGYEHYTQAMQLLSATGTLGDLTGGTVQAEVWSAIGNQPTTLGVGNQSELTLPFR